MEPYFDLGTYTRGTSTASTSAQTWFDRGLVWSYAFHHEEAIRCFEREVGAAGIEWVAAAGAGDGLFRLSLFAQGGSVWPTPAARRLAGLRPVPSSSASERLCRRAMSRDGPSVGSPALPDDRGDERDRGDQEPRDGGD